MEIIVELFASQLQKLKSYLTGTEVSLYAEKCLFLQGRNFFFGGTG